MNVHSRNTKTGRDRKKRRFWVFLLYAKLNPFSIDDRILCLCSVHGKAIHERKIYIIVYTIILLFEKFYYDRKYI